MFSLSLPLPLPFVCRCLWHTNFMMPPCKHIHTHTHTPCDAYALIGIFVKITFHRSNGVNCNHLICIFDRFVHIIPDVHATYIKLVLDVFKKHILSLTLLPRFFLSSSLVLSVCQISLWLVTFDSMNNNNNNKKHISAECQHLMFNKS